LKSSIFFTLSVLAASLPAFGNISYTCDATIDGTQAGTCAYLNSITAGLYKSTFSNANASIYIQMGITGLGSSTQYFNYMSYSNYRSALITDSSGDAVDTGATASLPSSEPALYSGGQVEITGAIGQALCTAVGSVQCAADGITSGPTGDLTGITSTGGSCNLGTAGCYNGVITITTPANLLSETGNQGLYWDQTGGSQPALDYDFYSIVEHETDEILVTSSCISTSNSLADVCGGSDPSAVDLFRYNAGALVLISTTPGAYFSYNGGVSNGVSNGSTYNTLANGDDYADFATNCTNVQDATGCLGAALNITTDGGAEKNILDAVGFNLATTATPEPATFGLLGASLLALGAARARRKK
jgi:hypothetical protein